MPVAATSTRPSHPFFRALARWSRMNMAGQVIGSFVAVLAVYLLYWLLAVPLIEPDLEPVPVARATPEQLAAARDRVGSRQRDIARFFPAGSWELDKPSILERGQTRLLFKSYKSLPGGKVKVEPCTIMLFPKTGGKVDTEAQPVIMRTEQGATVTFDQPVDPRRVDFEDRQLTGCSLPGAIRIYRNESGPGQNDELEITTRDVEMVKDRVSTPHAVDFRLGRSHGRGKGLQIDLAAENGQAVTSIQQSSVRRLQLLDEVRMFLDLGSKAAMAGGQTPAGQPQPPIEITCDGTFEFLVQELTASFHKNVNVLKPNVPGEADQLNGEVLTAYFQRGPQSAGQAPSPEAAGKQQLTGLHVRSIEVRGAPVTLRSPMRGIYARCPGIDYLPGPTPERSTLVAWGPGTMQGHLSNDPAAKYDASWAEAFRFEPDGPASRATLRGAVAIRYAQMGNVNADEITAWLVPSPHASAPRASGAPPESQFKLQRVVARTLADKTQSPPRPVVIDAPQLHGTTMRLEAVVEQPQAAPGGPAGPAEPSQPAAQRKRPQQNPTERFAVRGQQVLIKLVPIGEQLALSAVTIEHQAQLEQIAMAQPTDRPLVVRGDRLHVAGADTESTRVTVSGKPGYVEAGGMALSGRVIEMDKQARRVWIDGPGRMTMPLDQDFDGKPLASPQTMVVNWQGGMNFQSNTVVFQKRVQAQSEHHLLETEKLEGVLSRPIVFDSRPAAPGRPQDRPQLATVRCHGPVRMKSRQFDPQGKQSARSLIDCIDLSIDRTSGDIHARGPGYVTHVSLGTSEPLRSRGPTPPGAPVAQPVSQTVKATPTLTYLNVTFQNTIQGNLNRREITFADATKTVYGPVPHWDATLNADDPRSLGPQGMLLEARTLTVREMPRQAPRERGWFELEAQGNIVAEGSGYTARGDRLTYSEDKDLIVLRGDGFSPAEIFQEDPNGGQRRESTANEINYWPSLQLVRVSGFKAMGVDVPKPPKQDGK